MHAWSEVEHDLVYKPSQGALSEDEYAILDEINGMVIVGEIALERLQRAGDARIAARDRTFANHYELAAHLLSVLRDFAEPDVLKSGLGRVDLLFDLIERLKLCTPEAMARYLESLHSDLERRPIADQIVDQILSEDPDRYQIYETIRGARSPADSGAEAIEPVQAEANEAMGEFLSAWIEFERSARETVPLETRQRGPVPTLRVVSSHPLIDDETRVLFERLRRMRNQLVHGLEIPDSQDLREAAGQLHAIRKRLFPAE
jgi:hypothetical protein